MRTIVAVAALVFGVFLLVSSPPGKPGLVFKVGMTAFFVVVFVADLLQTRADRHDEEHGGVTDEDR